MVTVLPAVSLMLALVAALAVMFATFVLKAFAVEVPPIPPLVDASIRLVALTVPVIFALNRSLNELKVTVPTGVTALPMAACTFRVPAWAFKLTVEAGLAFATSIVAVVLKVLAFVATKLKLLRADDAPLIVTVPVAVSDTKTLPLPALAMTLAAAATNGEATLVPTLPFSDVRLRVWVFNVPVIVLLNRLL